jgi:hypothetical protein
MININTIKPNIKKIRKIYTNCKKYPKEYISRGFLEWQTLVCFNLTDYKGKIKW